jgi:hypothetical protein
MGWIVGGTTMLEGERGRRWRRGGPIARERVRHHATAMSTCSWGGLWRSGDGARNSTGRRRPSTQTPPLRAFARRVDRVLTATLHPPPHSTRPHAYEPLLVGWITGADWTTRGRGEEEGDRGMTAPLRAPAVLL